MNEYIKHRTLLEGIGIEIRCDYDHDDEHIVIVNRIGIKCCDETIGIVISGAITAWLDGLGWKYKITQSSCLMNGEFFMVEKFNDGEWEQLNNFGVFIEEGGNYAGFPTRAAAQIAAVEALQEVK